VRWGADHSYIDTEQEGAYTAREGKKMDFPFLKRVGDAGQSKKRDKEGG